ncbi:DUF1289 domain-containing protein [Rhizobium helianthi]|uniref:DUF1289 domain-containing protein n=1 Tax=Rhizobium helianthi TaxID=1132695 RepID=A0ABW4M1A9_9HYPH
MITPCILVCSLDIDTGLCVGCGRTGEEIGAWTSLSDDQRREVMAELPSRLAGIASASEIYPAKEPA